MAWIDALAHAGQTWWQILPLGPTGYGDSPYQCFSAFAGNPYLVSPQALIEDGLLDPRDVPATNFPADRVDYGPVIRFKNHVLSIAWEQFQKGRGASLKPAFEKFVRRGSCLAWTTYALFMAVKDSFQGRSWHEWPEPAKMRNAGFLKKARTELAKAIGLHQFRQFLFFRQWRRVKQYANEHGIKIIGDIPIFVSSDSADVWANPQLFMLDAQRRPNVVAGVPPDYFSATGQLWGNPHYDWPAMEKTGFAWWIARFRSTFSLVDMVRLDHFRGFEAYWEIPAGSPNAINGRWVKGPGNALLQTLKKTFGPLPIIAEDLGVITPEVDALRLQLRPARHAHLAIRVRRSSGESLLAAQLRAEHRRLHRHARQRHDVGLVPQRAGMGARSRAPLPGPRRQRRRLGPDPRWPGRSVAEYAIAPLQDVLNLGAEARMNFPGKPQGNWAWRYPDAAAQSVDPGSLGGNDGTVRTC